MKNHLIPATVFVFIFLQCVAIADGWQSAICRIQSSHGNVTDVGTGTLVSKDESVGTVLTCAHIFRDSSKKIVVTFVSGNRYYARLHRINHDADLATILIANPKEEAVAINSSGVLPGAPLTACGIGLGKNPRCIRGAVLGYATSKGQHSIRIRGMVRSGDSGGPIVNSNNQLVAVVWGAADGETYGTSGEPFYKFTKGMK